MLQQIIDDMYIDPELLEELDDDQKQVLFCKIREEQVRRYNDMVVEEEGQTKNKNKRGHNVDWILDTGGDPWTWVMGDHRNDRTISQIVEEESHQQAMKQALEEAAKLEEKACAEMQRLQIEEDTLEADRKRKEAELKKKEEEAALYQTMKEAKEAKALLKLIEEDKRKEKIQREKLQELKRESKRVRRQSSQEIENIKSRRSTEIYTGFKDIRKKFEKEAEQQNKEITREWKKQEEKAKRIEVHRRDLAFKARKEYDEYRRSLVATTQFVGKAMIALNRIREQRKSITGERPAVPGRSADVSIAARSGRPSCRAAIVDWFKTSERPKQVGIDHKTKKHYVWFHGMISRTKAEELLEEKEVGSYLIRVSERIFGYAISYRDEERCKHYLINALDEGKYQFFGSNQVEHKTLPDLVHYHKTHPVSVSGGEKLKHHVGQPKHPPNYEELYEDNSSTLETTKL